MGTHKLKSSGGYTLAGPTEDDADGDEGGGEDDAGLREWEGEGQAYSCIYSITRATVYVVVLYRDVDIFNV